MFLFKKHFLFFYFGPGDLKYQNNESYLGKSEICIPEAWKKADIYQKYGLKKGWFLHLKGLISLLGTL